MKEERRITKKNKTIEKSQIEYQIFTIKKLNDFNRTKLMFCQLTIQKKIQPKECKPI
jgi:hypothetical protein